MKKVLFGLMFVCLAATAPVAMAQTGSGTSVSYTENVLADEVGKEVLYQRALDWAQNHFSYGPKTGPKSDAAAGTVRVTGTGKVKPVATNGKEMEQTIRFDFVFRASDKGYEYSVGSFRLVPNPQNPEETEMLSDYISRLATEKGNNKTFNDRRVTAQANNLASEAAMSFRSFMNTMPAAEESSVGVPAAN
ncbi:DUF4468 domain-containing protein [Hymenobacter cellulosivorans]|uniref:DUF4468 domain-containing protein n=1 Tax=Hymenobacter cellulosivorans TaxID=2932249 RepID=A0ABY4FC28_9BACT|nr:DUF4468 domain-containing protein [Hymenobacter cellulosivorans]UOQ53637.1 DUF4468 domain-containing protein [Hymenobacter cellulosivorans]